MNLGVYNKTVTALVSGLLGWGAVVITSERASISASEWLGLASAVAVALGVYVVPNTPARRSHPERGAVDSGSLALGILIGVAMVWAMLALVPR